MVVKADMTAQSGHLTWQLIHQQVADESPIILWMTDADGNHVYYNQRWYEFTGSGTTQKADGEFWLQSLHPDDKEECLRQIKLAMRDYQSMRFTYRLRNADGEYCWMLDQSRPCFDQNKVFLGYVGAVVDISDQKKAEQARERTNYDLARANKHARINRQMNDHLQVCNDMSEVQAVLSHFVPKLFSKSSGAVYMINESHSLVESVTQWGHLSGKDMAFTREDCWALRQGKAHWVTEYDGVVCSHLNERPAYGYACIPLISHGDVMGLLYLQNNSAQQMNDDYRYQLAINTSENLSLALSSFSLRQALRYQSVRDPLTRLYNRRYMLESLEREIARMKRNDAKLAVIMLDLDHFKRFNDTHGHAAGDAVLQALAEHFQSNLRTEDIASRYGGEEFTLVLGNIDVDNAVRRAESLRQGVQELDVVFQEQPLGQFSVSMGLAMYPADGDTPEALLQSADRALYQAKEAGRNRVCLAADSPTGDQ